jgi:hypothetical protein
MERVRGHCRLHDDHELFCNALNAWPWMLPGQKTLNRFEDVDFVNVGVRGRVPGLTGLKCCYKQSANLHPWRPQ